MSEISCLIFSISASISALALELALEFVLADNSCNLEFITLTEASRFSTLPVKTLASILPSALKSKPSKASTKAFNSSLVLPISLAAIWRVGLEKRLVLCFQREQKLW
jgi:hypothetical protein